MNLVKEVQRLVDEKIESLEVDDKHAALKAFGLGAVNGYINAAVICYPIIYVACCYWKHKAESK